MSRDAAELPPPEDEFLPIDFAVAARSAAAQMAELSLEAGDVVEEQAGLDGGAAYYRLLAGQQDEEGYEALRRAHTPCVAELCARFARATNATIE